MKSIRKIRVVFIVFSTVLLVSLALLIRKAYDSAARERSAGHQAAAERIFDEMERELTTFLEREENRPFEHYRASFLPDAARQGGSETAVRSPLAGVPEEEFLLGFFQLHPDGSFSSPHRSAVLETSEDPSEAAEIADWVDGLEEVVRLVWRLQEDETSPKNRETSSQKAGSTVEVAPKVASKKKDPGKGLLYSLNRGALSRGRRSTKYEQTQAANVVEEVGRAQVTSELKNLIEPGYVDVRLEQMVGRSASPGLLVLYRTVSVDERAYRQGLLINESALIGWLARRVLPDRALASRAVSEADADPGTGALPPSTDFAGYTYRHRFAEPFGTVHGVLHLEELPDLAGTAFLSALSILLVLTATLGLFGLYRMVAVVVEFAERRHNFVSAVTHELKTPLTAIRMYGEMLRDGVIPDESKRQQYYETITAETERLTRLLQNVLELARLEKDTRAMNLAVGEVGPVVHEVAAVLEPHAREKGFVLRVEVEPELPQVRYDRDALVQVLFNLVDNALKYAARSEPREIVLRCRRQGEGVALAVVDHGPGVSREHLGKIFEPFYRGENELTRTAKGTGIGLALVRGLVERMGGRVVGRNVGSGGFEVVVSLSAL